MSELDPETLGAALLETTPDLVYVVDSGGKLVWWNDRLPEVTSYADEELSGMRFSELVAPDQREAALDTFDRVEAFSPAETLEFDLVTSDGECVPYEFNGSVLEIDDRRFVATIARDVAARREREREIRRKRDELETLNRLSETVYGVIQAVVDAASREEIEAGVCERLAASELYRAVWIGRSDPDGTVDRATGVGPVGESGDEMPDLAAFEWTGFAETAIETGEVAVVQRVPDSDLPGAAKAAAAAASVRAGAAVPIVHRDVVDGVLCVYSSRPDAFSEREQAAFERLGEVVGFAINAVRTERLLVSDTATELTFRVSDSDSFLASVSDLADGACRKEWSTPVEDGAGNYRHYVTVSGLDREAVFETAEGRPTVVSVEYLGDNGEADVFAVVTSDSFTRRLLAAGATSTSLVARNGETAIVAELPGDADIRPVVAAAAELFDAELISKREVERPVRTTDEFHDAVVDRLTERQRAALRHAYFGGYFSWPRDATAEEIADRMGVSSPTFHYHIRHAQRALVESFLQYLDD